MGNLIFWIYLVIGLIIMLYDWYKYQEPIYKEEKAKGMIDNSMAVLYILTIIVFWPIKVIFLLFRKNK